MKGSIQIDRELCKGCQICIEFCKRKVITLYTKVNAAGYIPAMPGNMEECNGCGVCAIVCPEVAIEVYRE
jgi:2-oxoglutarate ferredoxin oxidoreductase subunit delta